MKKSILSLALAVIMVMALLTVGAFAEDTMTAEELQQALNAAQPGATVTMTSNVTVSNNDSSAYTSAVITVPAGVTLDGDGYEIIADADAWIQKRNGTTYVNANHILGVSNGSKVIDLTIVGTGYSKSGIHAYKCTQEVTLENVTIMNCGNAAVQVNGSVVKAINLKTSGNAWGSVNVDVGSSNTPASFNLVSGDLGEEYKIWSEKSSGSTIGIPSGWVTVNGAVSNDYVPANDLGANAVYNETDGKYYRGLDYAVAEASENAVLKLEADAYLTKTLTIDKTITIDGQNNTIYGSLFEPVASNIDAIVIKGGVVTIQNVELTEFDKGSTAAYGSVIEVAREAADGTKLIADHVDISIFARDAFTLYSGSFDINNCTIDCKPAAGRTNTLTKGFQIGFSNESSSEGYGVTGTISNTKIFNSTSNYEDWGSAAIEVFNDAYVSIDGCEISSSQSGIYIDNYWGGTAGYEGYTGNSKIDISNTKIDAGADGNAVCVYSSVDPKYDVDVVINSGDFIGEVSIYVDGQDEPVADNSNNTLTVNGGTFSAPVAMYVADSFNYELNNGGEYTYYSTLEAAIAAAKPGAEIKPVDAPSGVTMHNVVVNPANGGKVIDIELPAGTEYTLPNVTNSGYIFLGWRDNNNVTHKAGEAVTITADTTFVAVWGNLPDVKPSEPETPETPVFPFYDVTARDWYYSAVKYVYEKGLMDGVDVGVFAPNDTLTRAMVWTIIARAEGVDTTGGATWYAKAQEWVTAKGISDGENPSAAITRQELVTMLYRLAGEPAVSGTITAPDASSVSTWAQSAMTWAMNIGLVEGDENGAVTPTATATRAQAAALIMRYLEA